MEIVDLTLADGTVVWVEAEDVPPVGPQRVSRGGQPMAKRVGRSFEAALETIRPAAETVVQAFQEFNRPDELGLEFSLKFSAQVDAFVFSGDSEATFKVTLKWKNEPVAR